MNKLCICVVFYKFLRFGHCELCTIELENAPYNLIGLY